MKSSSLNHVYRIVWNAALGVWQTASEVTTSRGKSKSSKQQRLARRQAAALAALGALGGLGALPGMTFAAGLPTGGVVVGGQATINQSGNALNIVQGSDKAAIDWQSFSIGTGKSVNFQQPSVSSVALNRVLGNDVSVIQGAINANGQVFLVNQNGVLFTPTAQVNVGGIVASTQNISTEDFLAGNYTFSGSSTAKVENQGSINAAAGGYVALIAAKIINSGTVVADRGTVGLAAGKTVVVDLGGPVKLQVSEGALNTAITQSGGIRADGGQVYLTAKAAGDLASSVINHTGVTRARTLASNQKGEIILLADMAVGATHVAGTLDASAPDAGDGGFIETSAAKVKVADGVNITTKSAQGQTGAWLIDPVDFTIAATGGDLTGAQLSAILNDVHLTIQTTSSSASCVTANVCGAGKEGNGDIHVNDAVSWSSPGQLTLSAYRNVNINADITATGAAGKLALEVGQGSAAGEGSDYHIKAGNKVNLQAGSNFSLKKGANGATDEYKVITQLGNALDANLIMFSGTLQSLAGISPVAATDKYVLGADIDASATAQWNSPAGFKPIGSDSVFTGQFHGLGHTVSNLTINRPTTSHVGLFAKLGAGGMVRDVGMLNATVRGDGFVGALVGDQASGSFVKNAHATGGSVAGDYYVGGLIGYSNGGTIDNAHANVGVTGRVQVGGLLGYMYSGAISNAYAQGSVKATGSGAGGLVGLFAGNSSISNAYATGNVTANSIAGGLVGEINAIDIENNAVITNAYATGTVGTLPQAVNSFAFGGLVGYIQGDQMGSGGSVTISNTYATGTVQGPLPSSGALVGIAQHDLASATISNSFWDTSTVYNSNMPSSPLNAVGGDMMYFPGMPTIVQTNVSGKTTAQMKDKATFAGAGWNIGGAGGEYPTLNLAGGATVWQIGPDSTPLYIRLSCLIACTSTYGSDATLNFGAFGTASGTSLLDSNFTGTASYNVYQGQTLIGTSLTGLTDAGTYTITYTGGLTANAGYTLNVGDSVQWVVNPLTLTVELQAAAGSPLSKVYNGDTSLALAAANFKLSGFVGTQGTGATLSGVTTGVFNSKDVVGATTVTADLNGGSLVLGEGVKASNYVLPTSVAATGSITPKALTVTGSTVTSKAYDGGKTAKVVAGTLGGLVAGESLGLTTASGEFASKDAGSNQDVTASYTLVNGADQFVPTGEQSCITPQVCLPIVTLTPGAKASNYTLAGETLKGNITKRDVTVSGITAAGKTYDGSTSATISKAGVLSNLVGSETLVVSTTGSFTNKDAGERTVNTSTSLANGDNGGLASNYNLTNASGSVTAEIAKRALTVAGIVASGKVYDGKIGATISNEGTLDGLVDGETLAVTTTGSFDSKNAGARTVNTSTTLGNGTGLASNYSLSNGTGTASATISQKALTVSGLVATDKTYDGTRNASVNVTGAQLTGLVVGDELSVSATGLFADKNAATGKAVTLTSSYTGADKDNYLITDQTSSTASISKREITGVTGVSAQGKVYDGTTTARVSVVKPTFVNSVSGDDLALVTSGGSFANANAGVGKTVTLQGVELDGADAGNYVLSVPVTATATIDQRTLTASGFKGVDKVYDGTTTAALDSSGSSLSGVLQGDLLSVGLVASGAFDDKNAGSGKHVGVSLSLSGAGADNYKLSSSTLSTTASITPRTITGVTGVTAKDKVYDGTTSAKFSMSNPVFDTLVAGDDLSLVTAGATFADANAGTNKTVTLQDVELVGADAGNYVLGVPVTAKATIDQRALTVSGITASDKVYDGTTSAVVDGSQSLLGGVLAGDVVGVIATGEFADKNAGKGKLVDLSVELSGVGAGNYKLSSDGQTTATATITPRAITRVEGLVVHDKEYDGTKSVVLDLSGTSFNTLVAGDDLSMVSAKGRFLTASAGTDKMVYITNVVLAGADAGNYSLPARMKRTATIDQRALTVSGYTAKNKVYDGTTTAVLNDKDSLVSGVLSGDVVGVSAIGEFADKNAGTGKHVDVSMELTGRDAGNYKLSSATQVETKATITPRAITRVEGLVVHDKEYDGTKSVVLDLSGTSFNTLVAGDDLSMVSAKGQFLTASAGTDKMVYISNVVLAGADAGNYSLPARMKRTATIDQRALTVSGITAVDKEYDGTKLVILDNSGRVLSGVVSGEVVGLLVDGEFDDKNAATNKHVGLSVSLTGAASGNYKLSPTSQTQTTASITPKSLTDVKGIQVADKEYDGTTVAYFYFNQPVLSQVLAGDDVKLLSTGASFADAEVGADKLVTVNGVKLAGVDAKNYRVTAPVTTTASIIAAE